MMIISITSFLIKFNFFFCALLTLEFMVLITLLYLTFNLKLYFCLGVGLYFIILSVCEGCLGISLLVFLVRSYGSDYMYPFTLL